MSKNKQEEKRGKCLRNDGKTVREVCSRFNKYKIKSKYVVAIIDYFTKIVKTEVIKNKEAETVVKVIRTSMKDGHGEDIMTDNGKEFASFKFQAMCKELSIKHTMVGV